ncbi:DUF7668 domain-containing protein [Methylomonas koyamae]|uniref:DUF7668 domain-containing protein n=1 Tax=Methylomonas koyamae TaxID=702114 RepID=UPI0007C94564|nr:hypothetical protein [Methylomonas koyamae]
MKAPVLVSKDENGQALIPSEWRNVLVNIVEAFKEGDFKLDRGIHGVRPVDDDDAVKIERNIKSYGVELASLPEDTWQTSVCQWMQGYWDVLIDLYTVEEGASDLVLFVRVHENGSEYVYEVQSVYVP